MTAGRWASTRQDALDVARAWVTRGGLPRRWSRDHRGVTALIAAGRVYPRVELVSRHPLLVQHDEPSRSLYLIGTPLDPRSLAETLDGAVRTASEGWRRLSDYADRAEARLRTGHGLLMNAPESVCAIVVATLDDEGVRTSILGSAGAHPGYRVLLLGRSYAIARAFVFERRTAS